MSFHIDSYSNQITFIESESHSAMSDSLPPHELYRPWNSPCQNAEVVAFPFSRASSQPRDLTQVSRFAGGLFTIWATREAEVVSNSLWPHGL